MKHPLSIALAMILLAGAGTSHAGDAPQPPVKVATVRLCALVLPNGGYSVYKAEPGWDHLSCGALAKSLGIEKVRLGCATDTAGVGDIGFESESDARNPLRPAGMTCWR